MEIAWVDNPRTTSAKIKASLGVDLVLNDPLHALMLVSRTIPDDHCLKGELMHYPKVHSQSALTIILNLLCFVMGHVGVGKLQSILGKCLETGTIHWHGFFIYAI